MKTLTRRQALLAAALTLPYATTVAASPLIIQRPKPEFSLDLGTGIFTLTYGTESAHVSMLEIIRALNAPR